MKTEGNKLVMESTPEAVQVWSRPHCVDKIGGGASSVVYAVYDYLGIDIKTPGEYRLSGATKGITRFYEKLCENSYRYSSEDYWFVLNGNGYDDNPFPEDSDILKVLVAYRDNPSQFTLDWVESDSDLQIVITNTKNNKQFKVSVIGSPEEHSAYFVLLAELHRLRKETASVESKIAVSEFLSDN